MAVSVQDWMAGLQGVPGFTGDMNAPLEFYQGKTPNQLLAELVDPNTGMLPDPEPGSLFGDMGMFAPVALFAGPALLGGGFGGLGGVEAGISDAALGELGINTALGSGGSALGALGEVPSWMGNQTFWTDTAGGGGLLSNLLGGSGGGLFGLSPLQTMIGGQLLGGLIQGGAGLIGAKTQADAAKDATNAQLGIFNTLNAQGAPYRAAGYGALNTIGEMQPYFNRQFTNADLNAHLAPNYQFMLDQGLGAVRNAANAQTGLLSGNTLKGIADYATNFAGNAYQQAFNNFTTQQSNIFNRLSTIAGLGNASQGQSTQLGGSTMGPVGQSIQNYGTALGGGFVGAGNAAAGGLNNALSWYALPAFLGQQQGA